MTTDNNNTQHTTPRAKSGWITDMRYGQSISLEFFKANAWLMILIVVAILALIGLRYKTRTKMAEIKKLNSELQMAQSAKLNEKAKYMSIIRESEMTRMVQERRLNLQFQDQPPYLITVPGHEKR